MAEVRHITVSAEEGGQKLVNFLRRRLGPTVPQTLIMRIVRKGEVRVDGRRAKPFDRLAPGQDVRVPPVRVAERPAASGIPADLDILFHEQGILALAKPAGLPTQPGSGHTDALSERLRAYFAHADFTPTPAHRLDRDTSGIVLCGASYEALIRLQQGFAEHSISKRYLAWVHGSLAPGTTLEMRDDLEKTGEPGNERVTTGQGKQALAIVTALAEQDGHTLLEIDLRTGRTHQIRVQLASRNLPIVGDAKYGTGPHPQGLMLHAWRVTIPDGPDLKLLPSWTAPFDVQADLLD